MKIETRYFGKCIDELHLPFGVLKLIEVNVMACGEFVELNFKLESGFFSEGLTVEARKEHLTYVAIEDE